MYLNFSSIWHLCNFLRNLGAGWLLQINGDATYKVCRRGVAIYVIGVNSIPHVSNPVCFAVIPEVESKKICQGTWRAVQQAAFMMMKRIKTCDDAGCLACCCIKDLMGMTLVKDFLTTDLFEQDRFEVIATLSDQSKGWTAFTLDEFNMEPNMCVNHTTGIPAANYSQAKYYKSREVYDQMYDYMVRISKIGMDSIAEKAHEAVPRFLIEDCEDEDWSEYFHKTWSLPSGHGRWSVCHGQYGGYVTNASMETVWKDKSEMCPPSAPLGRVSSVCWWWKPIR